VYNFPTGFSGETVKDRDPWTAVLTRCDEVCRRGRRECHTHPRLSIIIVIIIIIIIIIIVTHSRPVQTPSRRSRPNAESKTARNDVIRHAGLPLRRADNTSRLEYCRKYSDGYFVKTNQFYGFDKKENICPNCIRCTRRRRRTRSVSAIHAKYILYDLKIYDF
jgi:hypothetical protein